MAGTFILGETKVRPGAYFNIQKKEESGESILEGVTAVLFRADFGPLNTVVELKAGEPWEETFGNGLTTDAIREAMDGENCPCLPHWKWRHAGHRCIK